MLDALVIDDNRSLADLMCMMLNTLGISGRPAYGSRSGLLALEHQAPDVVFLDINMPGIDGFEVLSYIRRSPGCEHVPVIVVTSDDQLETIEHAREMGAATCIIKPVTVDLLESSLKDVGLL
ncbi:MAG: response regulator [Chloroflexi bacterium]|nr:response regulator [Chloroflexota bacterium]